MKYKFTEWAGLFGSGAISFAIRYLWGKMQSLKIMLLNISIILSIIFIIVPAASEQFELSFRASLFLTWVLGTFNDKLMIFIEKKVDERANKKV